MTLFVPQMNHRGENQTQFNSNTSHIIRRTRKMTKIDSKNALSGLKFDTEGAQM